MRESVRTVPSTNILITFNIVMSSMSNGLMVNMYRGTAAFDIDGVLTDFEGKFCDEFGYDNRHLFDLNERFPGLLGVHKEIRKFVSDPNIYYGLSPIEGGVKFLREFIDRDYNVVIATARPETCKTGTIRWLNKYNIPYMKLIFTKDKSSELANLGQTISMLRADILVDDNPRELESAGDYYITPLCWKQPWNEYFFPKVWYDGEKTVFQENDETNPIEDYWKE